MVRVAAYFYFNGPKAGEWGATTSLKRAMVLKRWSYFLGQFVESQFGVKLDEHIEKVVVALSLMPPVIEYLKSRRERRRLAPET